MSYLPSPPKTPRKWYLNAAEKVGKRLWQNRKPIGDYLKKLDKIRKRKSNQRVSIPVRAKGYSTSKTSKGDFSRSSGFFKKGSLKKPLPVAEKGVVCTFENGGTITDKKLAVVGHTNYGDNHLMLTFTRAMVKALALEMNKPIEGMDQFIHSTAAGDLFRIVYKPLYQFDTQIPFDVAVYTCVGGNNDTWSLVANGLNNVLNGNNDFMTNQVELIRFYYQPVSTAVAVSVIGIDLSFAKIYLKSKSSFKIQNQTASATGGELDDVDNVPLYGKSYGGKGSGTLKLHPTSIFAEDRGLIANYVTGLITRNSTEPQVITEPPKGYELKDVKFVAKAKLDPGELRTSVLETSEFMYLNTFWRVYKASRLSWLVNNDKPYHKFGKFRFFVFEKMLENVGNGTERRDFKIAFEHNNELHCAILPKKSTRTAPVIYDFV